jgi:hypothetical protein
LLEKKIVDWRFEVLCSRWDTSDDRERSILNQRSKHNRRLERKEDISKADLLWAVTGSSSSTESG